MRLREEGGGRRGRRLGWDGVRLTVLSLSFGACSGASSDPAAEGAGRYPQLEPCERGEGLCGQLEVPLDPASPEGATLNLAVRVQPARAPLAEPEALYVLVGGPGQAATEVGPMMAPLLDRVADKRDIVFVDQRGTGRAGKPASLACELDSARLADFFDTDFPTDDLRACLAAYDLDTRYFTTENSVADLEVARKHFGHQRIHLYGASYGTRLALSYLRRHPEPVVTAVLDGVAPPSISLLSAMDRGAHEMLERTFADCEAAPACAQAFPRLRERFDAWRSGHREVGAQLAAEHPRTGARESVEIKTDAVMSVLRSAIYSPEVAALIPLALERLMAGNADPLVGLAGMGESMGGTISLGLFISIVCAEDMRHVDAKELAWARENTRFGTRMHDEISELCVFWPVGEVPADHAEPVRAETPTLLLSGALDPATPARWGDLAARTLAHAHHIVVPGVGHNTSMTGCVPELIEDFVESGGFGPIERSCVEGRSRPPFFVSEAGPVVGGKAR